MHDAKGRELDIGDRVMIPCTITNIHLSADYCNANVKSIATMPGNNSHMELGAINTKQLLRANEGDDLTYIILLKPLGEVVIE